VSAVLTAHDAETFERCMAVGGVAVFPADTVYGLACEPDTPEAVRRLYALKGRTASKPAAVMLFGVDLALDALPDLAERTREAVRALLPGALTLLLPNPSHRFPLACGKHRGTLGLRVPALPEALRALEAVRWPVLQSSANLAGEPDARTLHAVPEAIRQAADLVLDGGELPGTPSTVVDLRRFERDGDWDVVRAGAVEEAAIAAALRTGR
jgi:L-threonylcarbamoyladenylate synthase